jgi:hypothetical protein
MKARTKIDNDGRQEDESNRVRAILEKVPKKKKRSGWLVSWLVKHLTQPYKHNMT